MTPLELAEKLLADAQSETEYRAAASRAYMATFQHLLAHRSLVAFPATATGADHRLLIEHLKTSTVATRRRIGIRLLPRPRSLRNHAGYDLKKHPFTRGLAEKALGIASEIIHDLLP